MERFEIRNNFTVFLFNLRFKMTKQAKAAFTVSSQNIIRYHKIFHQISRFIDGNILTVFWECCRFIFVFHSRHRLNLLQLTNKQTWQTDWPEDRFRLTHTNGTGLSSIRDTSGRSRQEKTDKLEQTRQQQLMWGERKWQTETEGETGGGIREEKTGKALQLCQTCLPTTSAAL